MNKFSVCEYLSRMETAALDILEDRKPVDQTIILWWGLDGLRLNEDGTTEWISRRKAEPVKQNVFYQPCQTRAPFHDNMCQSTKATREQIAGLKMQLEMVNFNLALQHQMQGFNSVLPGYYSKLTDCCCNRLI